MIGFRIELKAGKYTAARGTDQQGAPGPGHAVTQGEVAHLHGASDASEESSKADEAGLGQHGHLQSTAWGCSEQEVSPAAPRARADAYQKVEGFVFCNINQPGKNVHMHHKGILSR